MIKRPSPVAAILVSLPECALKNQLGLRFCALAAELVLPEGEGRRDSSDRAETLSHQDCILLEVLERRSQVSPRLLIGFTERAFRRAWVKRLPASSAGTVLVGWSDASHAVIAGHRARRPSQSVPVAIGSGAGPVPAFGEIRTSGYRATSPASKRRAGPSAQSRRSRGQQDQPDEVGPDKDIFS